MIFIPLVIEDEQTNYYFSISIFTTKLKFGVRFHPPANVYKIWRIFSKIDNFFISVGQNVISCFFSVKSNFFSDIDKRPHKL